MRRLQAVDWQGLVGRSTAFRVLVPVGLALTVLMLGGLLRWPELRERQGLQLARHAQLEQEHRSRVGQLQTLAGAQEALSDAERRLDQARWSLAAGEGMSDLLDRLVTSGHTQGLHIEQLDVLDHVMQAGYRQTPLNVQVVGRYSAVRQWLDDWLGQVRLLRPADMTLSAVEGRPGMLRLRLQVHTYHAEAPEPANEWLAQIPAKAQPLAPVVDPFAAWSSRSPRVGLEGMPLAQLEMVGSLARGHTYEALLLAAGQLHRVRAGDRLGRDEGIVVRIDERSTQVRERLYLGGAWQARTVVLAMRKRLEEGSREDDEMPVEVDRGGVVGSPAGHGGA
ncbi:type IV pili biogenesis protein [Pseudomonas sp. SWI6]|uniref:Pilus assembly protein PilP n=1 Tax=Pseudomonas taiwanensis TaxID=470150 RepID=A0ABR6V252_9PSED|nr:pilus assembly protein PilP [Pseudomonas taiwanensis]AVD85267.1 type IV pili biogenesis protein [Pseudomonas sp. SWI6]MPS97092.1 type IV pili biogenesis protein [Pseudomonas sp.]QQZ36636.1 pilus assembly protein PilP [Pseudomonas sp. SK2]MBC3474573.1 pilus assembly protein PilP [Pseudomonas taiwanensis]MBC3491600.1 pilus assembly protein PilP [Pseudomonas taiwanensis]